MPEQVLDLLEFNLAYPKNQKEERKKIPEELWQSLTDVLEDFQQQITQYPERIKPHVRPGFFIYCQPEPALEITYTVDEQRKCIQFISYDAPAWAPRKLVFICYSKEDEQWLGMLKKFLTPLEQQGFFKIWDDTQIRAGDIIKEEINKSLGAAKVAVLLITQDFLISQDILQNIWPTLSRLAKDKKVKIFWIKVSVCPVEDVLPDITATPPLYEKPLKGLSEEERDEAFSQIYQKIKAEMKKLEG